MTDWPHAPIHRLDAAGMYMVTAGTYKKEPLFNSRTKLNLLQSELFSRALAHGAALQAWAIFPNHYHWMAKFTDAARLTNLVRELHSSTARSLNEMDRTPNRKVWFQFWDSHIAYQRSYFARVNYVHRNAVHHGIVRVASSYDWCSAGWFEREATPAFRKNVLSFPATRPTVPDDFAIASNFPFGE